MNYESSTYLNCVEEKEKKRNKNYTVKITGNHHLNFNIKKKIPCLLSLRKKMFHLKKTKNKNRLL